MEKEFKLDGLMDLSRYTTKEIKDMVFLQNLLYKLEKYGKKEI